MREAINDTVAKLEERLAAAEARGAELAEKVDNIARLLSGWLDQQVNQAKQSLDPRAGERVAKGGGAPVKFGSTTPYDAQVDRIGAKRRELLGGGRK
jgi:hypothetical protein